MEEGGKKVKLASYSFPCLPSAKSETQGLLGRKEADANIDTEKGAKS